MRSAASRARQGAPPSILRGCGFAALLALAGCADGGGYHYRGETLPAGSDPERVRAHCTDEGLRAASLVGYPPDFSGARRRAEYEAFAACMARHNVRP